MDFLIVRPDMERSTSSGKTLGSPTVLCGGCDEGESTHYCAECLIGLCSKCERIHRRGKLYQTHRIVPIAERYASASVSVPSQYGSQQREALCSRHTSMNLKSICQQCIIPLCDTCATEHKGHTLIKAELGVRLLQKCCAKNVPELLEILQELEKLKEITPKKLELYRRARSLVEDWRNDIVTVANVEAGNLITVLDMKIAELEKYLKVEDKSYNLSMGKAEGLMAKLTEMSRVSDVNTLLINVSNSAMELNELKSRIAVIEKDTTSLAIDTILPQINNLEMVKKEVKTLFCQEPPVPSKRGEQARVTNTRLISSNKIDNVQLVDNITIPNVKGAIYTISDYKHLDSDTVVLYSQGKDHGVREVNTKTRAVKSYTCDTRINAMATLSSKRHAIVGFDDSDQQYTLHLLNERFRVIATMSKSVHGKKYEPRAVCAESTDSFIMREDSVKKTNTRFSRVRIENEQMYSCILGEVDIRFPFISSCLSNNCNTLLTPLSETSACCLHLKTLKYVTLDFTIYDPIGIWFVSSRNMIIVEAKNGRIFMFDDNGEYRGMFDLDGDEIYGVTACRGSRLVFSVNKGRATHIQICNIVFK